MLHLIGSSYTETTTADHWKTQYVVSVAFVRHAQPLRRLLLCCWDRSHYVASPAGLHRSKNDRTGIGMFAHVALKACGWRNSLYCCGCWLLSLILKPRHMRMSDITNGGDIYIKTMNYIKPTSHWNIKVQKKLPAYCIQLCSCNFLKMQ